jgi:hypothetical protein
MPNTKWPMEETGALLTEDLVCNTNNPSDKTTDPGECCRRSGYHVMRCLNHLSGLAFHLPLLLRSLKCKILILNYRVPIQIRGQTSRIFPDLTPIPRGRISLIRP